MPIPPTFRFSASTGRTGVQVPFLMNTNLEEGHLLALEVRIREKEPGCLA
jgi:hypothetical protein